MAHCLWGVTWRSGPLRLPPVPRSRPQAADDAVSSMPSVRVKPGDAPEMPLSRRAAQVAAPLLHRCFDPGHPSGAGQLTSAQKDELVAEINELLAFNGMPTELYTKAKLDCWASNQLYRWRAAAKKGGRASKPVHLVTLNNAAGATTTRGPTGKVPPNPVVLGRSKTFVSGCGEAVFAKRGSESTLALQRAVRARLTSPQNPALLLKCHIMLATQVPECPETPKFCGSPPSAIVPPLSPSVLAPGDQQIFTMIPPNIDLVAPLGEEVDCSQQESLPPVWDAESNLPASFSPGYRILSNSSTNRRRQRIHPCSSLAQGPAMAIFDMSVQTGQPGGAPLMRPPLRATEAASVPTPIPVWTKTLAQGHGLLGQHSQCDIEECLDPEFAAELAAWGAGHNLPVVDQIEG